MGASRQNSKSESRFASSKHCGGVLWLGICRLFTSCVSRHCLPTLSYPCLFVNCPTYRHACGFVRQIVWGRHKPSSSAMRQSCGCWTTQLTAQRVSAVSDPGARVLQLLSHSWKNFFLICMGRVHSTCQRGISVSVPSWHAEVMKRTFTDTTRHLRSVFISYGRRIFCPVSRTFCILDNTASSWLERGPRVLYNNHNYRALANNNILYSWNYLVQHIEIKIK